MKLTEFNNKPISNAKKALNEHFNTKVNFSSLGLYETTTMLKKVKGLLSELRESNTVASEKNPNYLKLVFMEEGLKHHYGELKSLPMYNTKIIVENEKIQQSQVLLAAQEMVDSMQKMIEQISDMLVKELPAVKQGIDAEFGTDQGEQFNSQASQSLAGLQGSLTQAKAGIEAALNTVTGVGGDAGGGFGADTGMSDMGGDDMGASMGDEMADDETGMGDEVSDVSVTEPEEEPQPKVGRAVR